MDNVLSNVTHKNYIKSVYNVIQCIKYNINAR